MSIEPTKPDTHNEPLCAVASAGSLRVTIALSGIADDRLGLGAMVCDCFSALGHFPRVVSHPDRGASDCDLLLIIGDGRTLTEYSRLFQDTPEPQAVAILWQIDCLPPMKLSPGAVNIALQTVRLDSKYRPQGPWRYIGNSALSRAITRLARRLCGRTVLNDLRRNNIDHYDGVSDHQYFTAFSRYANIRHHLRLGWLRHVVASTLPRSQFLASNGIDASYVPIGYHRRWGCSMNLDRDIDVLFLGRLASKRRRSIFEQCKTELAAHQIDIHVVDSDCYGQQRTLLLNRAKIVLDIVREFPGKCPLFGP